LLAWFTQLIEFVVCRFRQILSHFLSHAEIILATSCAISLRDMPAEVSSPAIMAAILSATFGMGQKYLRRRIGATVAR